MRMTFAQRGMYLEMLLEQWESFSLPDSADECADIIGGTVEEWQASWSVLRRNFVRDETTGRISNYRLERVRADRRRWVRNVARKGGIERARSANRSADGTYAPASNPATDQQGNQQGDQPRASSASASSSATATAIASVPPSEDSAAPLRDATPALLIFPTVGKGPTSWDLTQADVDEWAVLFPGLDIMAEARKSLAWLRANPAKKKTAKGMPRFLVRWFTTATDERGGGTRITQERPITAAERERAQQVRRAWGRCRHLETCGSSGDCIAQIVRDWRAREAVAS
jgi:uncharacterized protein YdaU (DUF1376 family)